MKDCNNPTITVIVPVYNTERYLPKCIESILHQTYRNLEIILVDDGSTDGSGEICDRYAVKDARIHVIHKENGGVSAARNLALSVLTGEYVCFVDADDWIPKNGLKTLHTALLSSNADIAFGTIKIINAFRNGFFGNPIGKYDFANDSFGTKQFALGMNMGPCAKLYKASHILENQVAFPEEMKWGEDTVFLCAYLQCCRFVCSVPEVVYFCNRINPESATQQTIPKIGEWSRVIVEAYVDLSSVLSVDDAKEFVSSIAKRYLIWSVNHYAMHESDCEIAYKNIQSVYNDLSPYIIAESISTYDDSCAEITEETLPMLLAQNHGAKLCYKYFQEKTNQRARNAPILKSAIKRMTRNLKVFWHYDLKL